LPEGSTQNLMDYSAGTELFKYQWDFIHNPEGGWFVWEDSEEGAVILKPKLAKVEVNSQVLIAAKPYFLLPGFDNDLEFSAHSYKNLEFIPLKVDWLFNGIEVKSQESASFTLSDDDLFGLDSINLTITEKVLAGKDSILVVKFIPLNISIEQIIIDELSRIAEAYDEFNSNRESLLAYIQEKSLMRILFTGQNDEYINLKMSTYFKEPSGSPTEEIDLFFYNMYNSDRVLQPFEEYLILQAIQVINKNGSGVYSIADESLVPEIKSRLEIAEENLTKEELEADYTNQIKNTIIVILNERANEN